MSTQDSFVEVMTRQRMGDENAAALIFDRFAGRLITLARQQLGQQLAGKVDAEDVVQSAYKSFFVRHRDGKLEPEGWQGLWKLLMVIMFRKCADRAAYFRAGRRDVSREVSPAVAQEQLAVGREPQPDEAAILAETVEELFRTLPAEERPILELSLQGYTAQEICTHLGRAERTVRRLRERIRKRLERMKQQR